jgi:hypothetical protein
VRQVTEVRIVEGGTVNMRWYEKMAIANVIQITAVNENHRQGN